MYQCTFDSYVTIFKLFGFQITEHLYRTRLVDRCFYGYVQIKLITKILKHFFNKNKKEQKQRNKPTSSPVFIFFLNKQFERKEERSENEVAPT